MFACDRRVTFTLQTHKEVASCRERGREGEREKERKGEREEESDQGQREGES